jgi:hypothetical protein
MWSDHDFLAKNAGFPVFCSKKMRITGAKSGSSPGRPLKKPQPALLLQRNRIAPTPVA